MKKQCIQEAKEELPTKAAISTQEIKGLLLEKQQALEAKQKSLLESNTKLSQYNLTQKNAQETMQKITQLQQCPVCLQQVDEQHKHSIKEEQQQTMEKAEESHKKESATESVIKNTILSLQQELEQLQKKAAQVQTITLKQKNLQEKETRLEVLMNDQETLKQAVGSINLKKIEIKKQKDLVTIDEKAIQKTKGDVENHLHQQQQLLLEQKAAEVKKEELDKALLSLEQELQKKELQKQHVKKLNAYQHWFQEAFLKLMVTMEKHVLHSVYHEFNDLFQTWFNILMEDETLSVRLDDEFSPVIEQNGHESFVENLSGGEKTAVALAYRLSLNKVINDVISDIKTKDLIILDEPTDGFSADQLDKMRLVLDELNMNQVIIVSHESKIESFVDHVIRVNKNAHISEIV